MTPPPVLPDYSGACVSGIVPALIARPPSRPEWMPVEVWDAPRVVLLVLDGLGWEQLVEHSALMPRLADMVGGPITTVCPSTTAAALTSITTGTTPGEHGIVGYRVRDSGSTLNTLRWRLDDRGDAREFVVPAQFQPIDPFLGYDVPVSTKHVFATTGFTDAHLRGGRWLPWHVPSSLVTQVRSLSHADERLVYAYYDGIDAVGHATGLGEAYRDELRAADRLVGDIIDNAAPGTAVLITADHGHIDCGAPPIELPTEILRDVSAMSGEGRFRWLHTRGGRTDEVAERCRDLYDDVAWVETIDDVEAQGWFGRLTATARRRLGDVALVAREPVSFHDPNDTGDKVLLGRHGSLTPAEMYVPLIAAIA